MSCKRVLTILLVVVIFAGLAFGAYQLFKPKPVIPPTYQKQVTSTLFMPLNNKEAIVDKKSFKYDSSLKVLSFNLQINGVKTVQTEQPTPESFVDIPDVYPKLVNGMNEYDKFDVDIGTVHLVHPAQLHGSQAAVINTKGTLMFVKPDKDLSVDQWRQFFNSLEVIK